MSGGSIDTKVSTGLASCYSNIFKLTEVNGLKWVIYAGPSTCVSPGNDPVLMSYAELLSQGYACAWRKLLPPLSSKSGSVTDSSAAAMVTGSNGGTSDGEDIKDLWIFHFTDLPDLSAAVSSELRDKGAGSWDEGMNAEATGMFFRALRNLAERTLVGEDFLTLGKWFAQPDHSMSGEERGCVLYSFSYFIHAHRYVCATVDVQSASKLYPLTTSLLSEALASQDGLQVLLSPSGINAVLTGHSYGATEEGIKELLDEWKLFYPQRFATSATSSGLPAAVEVVVAGARMKYPSQFLLVFYTGPSPPSSTTSSSFPNSKHVPQLWQDDLKFLEHQRNGSCNCKSMDVHRSSSSTKTAQQPSSSIMHSSTLKTELPPFHSGKQPHMDMSYQPKKEFPPPPLTSTSSGYTPGSKHHKKHVPKYTTPFPSPTTSQPTSPLVDKKPPTHVQTLLSSTNSKQVKGQIYDLNKMAGSITNTNSSGNERRYKGRTEGWWNCLSLPPPSSHPPTASAPVNAANIVEHKVSLSNLNLPPSLSSSTGVTTPVTDSSGMSPLKGRVMGNSGKGSRMSSSSGDKSARGRRNSSCGSPRQPKTARPRTSTSGGGGGNKRDRLTSMVDLGPSVLGSPLETDTFTPGYLSSNFFSMTPTGSISDFLSADPSMSSMSPNIVRKNDGPKLCTVESEQMQSGEHTIEKVDCFSAGSFANQQQQPPKSEAFKPTATKDYRSVKALEVTDIDIDLEHIFDDEEEDQDPDKMTKPLDTKGPTAAAIKPISTTSVTVMGPNPDYQMLARMFPTPPSVEHSHNPDEKPATYESQCVAEKMDTNSSDLLGSADRENEYVPLSFAPISVSDLPSSKLYPIPDSCIYTPLPPAPSSENSLEGKSVTVNNPPQTEANHFVFPPPPLPSRNQRISNLSLPIVSAQSPRSSLTPLLSSPAVSRAQNRFYKHVSSCTNTPVDSPIVIDGYTPTVPINQKLTPVFPEVHGLLVSLVLLESSFNDGLTETASYVGMGQMHVFPGRQFRLDSVSTIADMNFQMEFPPSRTTSASYYPGVDSSPLLASTSMDTITLGFQEDCPLAAETQRQQRSAGNTVIANGSTSSGKFNSHLLSLENEEQGMLNEDCLSLLQDICIQCVFAGLERTSISSLDLVPTESSSHNNETLYSPHCLLSALRTARKLTQTKQARTLLNNFKQDPIELKKGDNSALWLRQLSSLSTKLLVRKLRELKPMFSLIFHHTSSFKSAPQGPLLLREFYQNTPGQGDDCFPLLMQPLMVGLDQDWITVSPMAMFAWDKLMLEPFSLQKDILYVVACHNDTTLINEAKQFFTELSITYDLCRLGKLWALVKNAGEGGIMPLAPNNSTDPYQAYCKKLLGPFLSSLPTDGNTLFGYTRRPSHEVYPQLSLTSTQQLELPTAIVIYFIMEDGYSDLMQAYCTMLNEQAIPLIIKQRLHLQPVPRCCLKKDSQWSNSAWMKSLAFATFNQCRLPMESSNYTSSSSRITSVSSQRDLDKSEESIVGMSSLFTPLSILAPDRPLALSSLGTNINKTDWVLNGETELLLCAYCVSHDQKWLLATFCDRSGELLSTAVIGIHPANSVSEFTCRFLALEKLWMHCISLISASVFKWTIIITRLGQPSSREISDWPVIINANDGLITANQVLTNQCEACKARSCKKPSLENFLLLSVQPELNIQLLAIPETQSVSLSHVVVLPPDPSAVSSGSVTTPVAADFSTEDIMMFNPDDGGAGDMGGMDTDGLLNDLNEVVWNEDVIFPDDSQMPTMQGLDVNLPQASAYIFSVVPPGPLPEEFWGHKHHHCTQAAVADPDQSCSIFKVLYHYHLSMNPVPDSPQDTLSSVLACFDGLSWLNMDQIKGQRRSCLPLHLCVLSQLYRLIQSLSAKVR